MLLLLHFLPELLPSQEPGASLPPGGRLASILALLRSSTTQVCAPVLLPLLQHNV